MTLLNSAETRRQIKNFENRMVVENPDCRIVEIHTGNALTNRPPALVIAEIKRAACVNNALLPPSSDKTWRHGAVRED